MPEIPGEWVPDVRSRVGIKCKAICLACVLCFCSNRRDLTSKIFSPKHFVYTCLSCLRSDGVV